MKVINYSLLVYSLYKDLLCHSFELHHRQNLKNDNCLKEKLMPNYILEFHSVNFSIKYHNAIFTFKTF